MKINKGLTLKMKSSYLKSPLRCPWCRSGETEAVSRPLTEDGGATQTVMCCKCGRRWTDIYRLVNIREVV